MRVIIAGGSGLVGRALTAGLTQQDHEVVVLTRRPGEIYDLPRGARAVGWDGATPAGWEDLVDGATALVNLVGENLGATRWTPARKARILSSRVNAGQAMTAAVREVANRPEVLIQSSGVGYYGPHADEPITDSAPAGRDFAARVGVEWEASSRGVESFGVRRAVIRTGVVLSTEGGALPRLVLPFRFFVGGPVGSGKQWFSWVHIDDLVRAICFLIDRSDARGAFNVCAPQPVTNRTLAQTLGRVLRRPSLIPVPAPVLRLMFGEMATVVLDGQRVLPQRLLDIGFTFRYAELEPALRDLCYGKGRDVSC